MGLAETQDLGIEEAHVKLELGVDLTGRVAGGLVFVAAAAVAAAAAAAVVDAAVVGLYLLVSKQMENTLSPGYGLALGVETVVDRLAFAFALVSVSVPRWDLCMYRSLLGCRMWTEAGAYTDRPEEVAHRLVDYRTWIGDDGCKDRLAEEAYFAVRQVS